MGFQIYPGSGVLLISGCTKPDQTYSCSQEFEEGRKRWNGDSVKKIIAIQTHHPPPTTISINTKLLRVKIYMMSNPVSVSARTG
jgi:hypothetical protein